MTAPSAPSLFVMHACDPQEQASSFGMLDQSYEQISAGAFSGSLHALSADDVTLFQETLDQSVFQKGVSDPGYFTMAVAYGLSDRLYWNGRLLEQGGVVAYAPGRDFELRTPQRTACVGISLAPSALQSLAPGRAPAEWQKLFTQLDCWSDADPLKAELQVRIAHLLRRAGTDSAATDCGADLVWLRELTLDYLDRVTERGETGGQKLRADSYPRIARRARAFMLDHLEQPLSVSELCHRLGCSRRSLQYAFESVYDVSPVAYLRSLRLAAARRRLGAGGVDTTVQGVASAVGFSHPARFAQAYARMFGEPPSALLARHRAAARRR